MTFKRALEKAKKEFRKIGRRDEVFVVWDFDYSTFVTASPSDIGTWHESEDICAIVEDVNEITIFDDTVAFFRRGATSY